MLSPSTEILDRKIGQYLFSSLCSISVYTDWIPVSFIDFRARNPDLVLTHATKIHQSSALMPDRDFIRDLNRSKIEVRERTGKTTETAIRAVVIMAETVVSSGDDVPVESDISYDLPKCDLRQVSRDYVLQTM
jgi:hypothetical protein